MSTIDTLRRAEARLREAVRRVTPGPWDTWTREARAMTDVVTPVPVGRYATCTVIAGGATYDDAAYIALMDPLVGLALADWLGATADGLARRGAMPLPTTKAAHTLALRVLGEEG